MVDVGRSLSSTKFSIGFWNGGGAVSKRLIVNPGLKKYIDTKPDVWTYSESGNSKPQSLSLNGYKYFLHRSYLRDKRKCRRGMVIFYRQNTHNI